MQKKLEKYLGIIEDKHECRPDIWIVKTKNKKWQLCFDFTKTITLALVIYCPYCGVKLE